jgi:hypothetical protein
MWVAIDCPKNWVAVLKRLESTILDVMTMAYYTYFVLLIFGTSSVVRYSKRERFGSLICFLPQVKSTFSVGSASPNHYTRALIQ